MKIKVGDLAKALAAETTNIQGEGLDYDKFPHWKKIIYICEAKKVIKALKRLQKNG